MPQKRCEVCGKTITPNDSPAVPVYHSKIQNDQRQMWKHVEGEHR